MPIFIWHSYDVEVELVTRKGDLIWAVPIGNGEFVDRKMCGLMGIFQMVNERNFQNRR